MKSMGVGVGELRLNGPIKSKNLVVMSNCSFRLSTNESEMYFNSIHRGICYFGIEVSCASKDLHSGVFGGTV